MSFAVFNLYPGTAFVAVNGKTVLFGAPADAFKAVKNACATLHLAMPRTLVAPPRLVVDGIAQFVPEFFLYDLLFVQGAAFDPALANEKLLLAMPHDTIRSTLRALRISLTGPTGREMEIFAQQDIFGRARKPTIDADTISMLVKQSNRLAVTDDRAQKRPLDAMIEPLAFDVRHTLKLLNNTLQIEHLDHQKLLIRHQGSEQVVDLTVHPPIPPILVPPIPQTVPFPYTFGVQTLGARSGFDCSGPTTGFVIWVNGRAILYDGPVGTRLVLKQQGMSIHDVEGLILSHCHEDHMGAFLELLLAGLAVLKFLPPSQSIGLS